MNFPFNINSILPDEVTKIDSRLQICLQNGKDRHGYQTLKKMLFEVVDKMGDASAKAQKLPSTITSGKKLESSNHNLYVMKDSSGDQCCVIGILKVGTKKLFVYDSTKHQREMDPLCVLDFYVHESRQRMGCGRKLFDFMLRTENIPVQQMAVDRPSPKFLSFLKKHFRLHAQIPQVNNFVIFEGFFNKNPQRNGAAGFSGRGYNSVTPSNRSRPDSGRKSQTPATPQHHGQQQNHGNYPSFPSSSVYGNRQLQSPSYMAAGERMYSRHGATPPNTKATPPIGKDLSGIADQQSRLATSSRANSSSNKYGDVHLQPETTFQGNGNPNHLDNKMASPYMQYAMGTNVSFCCGNKSANATTQQQESRNQSQPSSAQRMYSGGSKDAQNLSTSVMNNNCPNAPLCLPDIVNGNSARNFDNRLLENSNVSQRPPSGKRNKPSEPPVLQRDGPPSEYRAMLNLHQTYQGRNGRFAVPAEPTVPVGANNNVPPSLKAQFRGSTYDRSYGQYGDRNWSVSGYLREQGMNHSVSSKYNPGRLW